MALIMAAGYSRRFGSDKRVAALPGGKMMIEVDAAIHVDIHTRADLLTTQRNFQ